MRGSRLGAIEGRASGVPRRRNAQLERVEEEAKSPDACRRTKSRPCPSWRRSRRAVEGLPAEDEISARMHAVSPAILACGQEIQSSWREGRARTLRMDPTRRARHLSTQQSHTAQAGGGCCSRGQRRPEKDWARRTDDPPGRPPSLRRSRQSCRACGEVPAPSILRPRSAPRGCERGPLDETQLYGGSVPGL